jgi:hypothetical protein
MKKYQVWFVQKPDDRVTVIAETRAAAIAKFASDQGVQPSTYIKAKTVDPFKA